MPAARPPDWLLSRSLLRFPHATIIDEFYARMDAAPGGGVDEVDDLAHLRRLRSLLQGRHDPRSCAIRVNALKRRANGPDRLVAHARPLAADRVIAFEPAMK